ncbi:hypothetical protein UFOVP410_20 [uncultured Caudovirales phage]|uniref:Tail completion and sheath stabilizer protein n=1 Tax=uncultured Caudovirales phage TaxID=2100421 RepID=A0A6J5M4W6_9CAUD|nr:hypothetical protein UFOVP410_20 [uncultured Caudovirales phage]
MTITSVQNRNFQSPLNYDFRVDKLTDFNFFVQKVNIPSIDLPIASNAGANPFTKIPYPGDHISFGDLSVDFKVSEGLYNWYEIFSWMESLGYTQRQKQFGDLRQGRNKDLNGKVIEPTIVRKAQGNIYGQATLIINSSQNNPAVKINFVDIHPVNLSEISLDTRDTDVMYVTSTVSFKYDYFTVEKLL